MSKADTNTKPLSFSFERPADEAELQSMYRHYKALSPSKLDLLKENIVACFTAFFSFVLVAPPVFLLFYLIEQSQGTSFLTRDHAIYALGAWMLSYVLYTLYNLYMSKSGVLGVLNLISHDVKSGKVLEEAWRFVEAISYIAPETDSRYYLVRGDNQKALFFHEEQLIGRPRRPGEADFTAAPADMVIIRGIMSNRLIRGFVSGPPLPLSGSYTLKATPPSHGAILSRDEYKRL